MKGIPMKRFQLLAFLSILAAFALQCGGPDGNILRVTSTLPSGIQGRDAMIPVTFSRGVVPADSVNQWTETPYITFSPAIPGKFVWEDTSKLVFSPDGQLPGDVHFTAKLNTDLLAKVSGAKSFEGASEFTFSTESFTLRRAEFFYDRIGEKRQVGIRANLEFTYAVNPQDILPNIKLTIDNEAMSLGRVMTQEKSSVIAVEIGTVTQLDKERDIAISFGEGLVSPETQTHLTMEKPFVYHMPALGEVQIFGHESGTDGNRGWIKVRTSQEIDSAMVRRHVVLEPARAYTVRNDGDGFALLGAFEPGSSFHFRIAQGMESVLGGKTQHEYEADIVMGNVAPSFGFVSGPGTYMLMGGQHQVELTTVNMPRLVVRVSQVFQNNLVHFIDNGRYYDYSYEYYDEEASSNRVNAPKYRYTVGNYGRQLSYDTLTIASPANRQVNTWFDLKPYLSTGYKGFYVIEIADPAQSWRSTSKLVSVSDIGIIVKRSAKEVVIFTTNLVTTEPMSGVRVTLHSTNNQVMGTATTGGDGVARFPDYQEKVKDFTLKLVTAETDADFNFINLEDYRVETSRFDVAGRYDEAGQYDALLYGDRNIYRPGEKIMVTGVVRDLAHPLPASMPVRLKVYNPQGTMVQETQHILNAEGSFETSMLTQQSSLTGEYRFELYTGNNLYLTSYKVSVEEFVPDRLRVTLTPSAESARPGETIHYELQAMNFFGPPAAGRTWEFEGSFVPVPFVSKAFPEFRFSDDSAPVYKGEPLIVNGKTDVDGRAQCEFTLPGNLTATGLLKAKGRVAVFDESGRPVYQGALTPVYPKPYFIGIKNLGAYYCSPNAPQKMQLVVVDVNDKPIQGFVAKVELVRYEWHSVLRQHPDTKTLRYVSERREILVRSDEVTLGKEPVDVPYMAPRSGDYLVRVTKKGDSGFNQFEFYAYSWGTSDLTSFEVDPEARVDIILDKKVYAPGDKAHVLFQAPFSGKLLVTVERNGLLSHQYLNVQNNAASMDINVDDNFLPNVYVTAVLFRKITDVSIPLMAGHGITPLMVEKPSNKIDVTIQAPEKIRPRTKQKVTILTGGENGVYFTLAAVDEGICQVKNYRTPDPYGFFYARKALETETADFFKHLLPEPDKGKQRSSTGGGEAEMGKKTNPLGVQRFKPLALWSGIIQSQGSGQTDVTLDIPEFSGEVRLMVFAYKGNRFGSAQKPMKVADPIVVTPALPRFLSPGDSLSMAITAFNTTTKSATLNFDIETTGGLVVQERSASLEVGANQERFVPVSLRVTNAVGKATVKIRTKALGESLESATDLAIRPVAPFATDVITGSIEGGKTASHAITDAYLPQNRRASIVLSPYPVVGFAKELKSLLGYPHGCLEQTVSKAFPQIYLRDIASIIAPTALTSGSPTYYVNEAITKITGMQLHDGSFAYWPGGTDSNPWTTVYATHFLFEAQRAGYTVMEGTLKRALEAVGRIARDKKTEDYYYYDANRVSVRRIAAKSSVYGLYVLALAGKPERPVMDFYRGERSLLTTDTRHLLAAAYALTGDRRTPTELIPAQFTVESPVRTNGDEFDSPTRAMALMLTVMLETDAANPQIPRMMEYLSKNYRHDSWYSTQDDAFTLLAFGKAARMASATKITGSIGVGSEKFAYTGGTQRIDLSPFGKTVNISLQGSGRVFYTIAVEGIRTDGAVKMEDRSLQVRREFLDRSGSPVNTSAIRQNDLLVVRLTLTSSVDRLSYVAISDLLPAGFEIENPRLTETTTYSFIQNPTVPEYMDIRDDRMLLYTSFRGGKRQQQFYYAVRAVTPGTFVLPPVNAEAMYDANYSSTSGQGRIRVVR
jgi:alpha-2-macroglobulin